MAKGDLRYFPTRCKLAYTCPPEGCKACKDFPLREDFETWKKQTEARELTWAWPDCPWEATK